MIIKVLGPGCPKCKETEKIVLEAVKESGVVADVEKVSDLQEIMKHGVFSTPAVIVDGKVKAMGKVPSKKDVIAWVKG
ncbi:thioredoxin family protein [Desulfocurvibacter africanus]|uniref:Redox-active disulfide protein 2 n=1 Tax=Desulfocurvibacter africanus subsp. africanus str. Walvis Bay TaxID=690850 RepID=F3Z433_DESAF|nr:thioredoxin family protein [Desulfocurvibacter africanus]EGJ50485.1 redox-active disulfide protein 2 [Desulfocurvibacter africanus subsp. africanus str. Walvis Bay]